MRRTGRLESAQVHFHVPPAGGIITFNCGPRPVTIVMSATARVIKTRHLVVLDGGGLITLSGGGKRRILYSDTCAGTWSTDDCVNQPYPQIVVQNITFEHGFDGAHQVTCTANVPRCWYGGVDGGGAIYVEGGQYENRRVYITHDSFSGGRCSNGGALSSISGTSSTASSPTTRPSAGAR